MLFDERVEYMPFEYPQFYDAWFKQQNVHWLHHTIPMDTDKKDWEINLEPKEKEVIGNILKGFTQTETEVGTFWSSMIPAWFPKSEIKMLGIALGNMETIHGRAYSYLNETLNLMDFKAFLNDEATMDKLGTLMFATGPNSNLPKGVPKTLDEIKAVARTIAIFSAAAEGIQLFSSFSVLFSFARADIKNPNRLRGVTTQMAYSIRDESLHSAIGCELFRTIIKEYPEIWDDRLKGDIYDAIELAIRNEFHYINMIFAGGDLDHITAKQVKAFIFDRANRKLEELGLHAKYLVNQKECNEMKWFYPLVSLKSQTDFFAQTETNYAKPHPDWYTSKCFDLIDQLKEK